MPVPLIFTVPPGFPSGSCWATRSSAEAVDCVRVTGAPFGSVRSMVHTPPPLGSYAADTTVHPAGTPAGISAGKPSAMAGLTALLTIGEGTGSGLVVSVALGEVDALGLSEPEGDAGALDVLESEAVLSSPSSEPHATAVTATSASPAMAAGIRVMRQVCLV